MKIRELIALLADEDPEAEVEMCKGDGTWAGHSTSEIGSVGYENGVDRVVLDTPMCGL